MTRAAAAAVPESYPRQEALTRRFRLGVPRGFALSPDGERAAFIRSAGGRDPVGSLWILEAVDGTMRERVVVDARDLVRDDASLPDAERARRERMRETTSGITAFTVDHALTRALFSLDGVPYAVDLVDPAARPVEVAHPGPVVDPQLSPDGATAAFVSDRAVHVASADGTGEARCLVSPATDDEAWGLADFIAAEELERVHGLWWLDDRTLLAEWVDESDVAVRWIADPANPDRQPVAHRYPAAGTANPRVALARLRLDGSVEPLAWDLDAYPYLATVQPDGVGGAVVSVLSRDQQRQLITELTPTGAGLAVVRERVTAPWITMAGGTPRRGPGGRLLEIVADTASDTFRLVADDAPLTPVGLQVCALVDADDDGLVVLGTTDPRDQHVLRVAWDGTVTALTEGPSVNAAVARGAAVVLSSTSPERAGATYVARLSGATAPVTSLAEQPHVTPRPHFLRVTDRDLAVAVLWPTGHVPGTRLPVVMAPYGGPHHARVVHAAGAFAGDQWLADQGFAVVVVDGVGTPGRGPAWEFGVHHDVAARVLDDQVAALEALGRELPDLDLDRVGITGWSFGGFLAALAVLDRPDVFHAAVAGAPVTDWALYDTAYTERYLGLPDEEPDVYRAHSLIERAAGLQRPLLVIHGLADDNVLAAHSLQFSTALLAAGRPHAFLPLSGVTHMTPQEDVAENLPRLEADFLTTHLC